MRQQAKPFTVEIKKSRKTGTEPQPLFGFLDVPAAPVPPRAADAAASDRLFGKRPDSAEAPDIAAVFGSPPPSEPARPVNRILPDLTAKPVAPVVPDEAPKARKPRASKPRAARPAPAPDAIAGANAGPPPAGDANPLAPMAAVRVRRRAKEETGLARGERWKRRLPRFAR